MKRLVAAGILVAAALTVTACGNKVDVSAPTKSGHSPSAVCQLARSEENQAYDRWLYGKNSVGDWYAYSDAKTAANDLCQ